MRNDSGSLRLPGLATASRCENTRRQLGTPTGFDHNHGLGLALMFRASCFRGGIAAQLFKTLLVATLSLGAAAGHAQGGAAVDLDRGAGLRGFNLGAMKQPALTDDDFRQLAGYGANLVRIGVKVARCDACSVFEMAPAESRYIDNTLAMGRKHGFRVILALTPEPGGEKSEFWTRADLRASLVGTWAKLAAAHKGDPVIAGYDLINEPVAPPDRNPTSVGAAILKRSGLTAAEHDPTIVEWHDFAVTLVQAIRAEDPASVVIYEPSPWGLPKGFSKLRPLPFEKIVYSFHFYSPHALTHQGVYNYIARPSYPNESTSKASLSKEMEPIRVFSQKYKVPIYVGEFGILRWAPGESAQRYLADLVDIFEVEGWNWTYHSFREYEGWDAEIDNSLPMGAKAIRSPTAKTIRLLIDKGFSKNLRGNVAR